MSQRYRKYKEETDRKVRMKNNNYFFKKYEWKGQRKESMTLKTEH